MLYTVPTFVRAIMTADIHLEEDNKPDDKSAVASNGIDQQVEKRLRASKRLVHETKKLFATLALSDKKYTDPSAVLHAIVDDYGNPIQIGEQKDIGEFNNTFLARIQEGLNSDIILAKLREESAQRKMEESKANEVSAFNPNG